MNPSFSSTPFLETLPDAGIIDGLQEGVAIVKKYVPLAVRLRMILKWRLRLASTRSRKRLVSSRRSRVRSSNDMPAGQYPPS